MSKIECADGVEVLQEHAPKVNKTAKNLKKNFALDFDKLKKIGFSVQVLWPKRIYKAQPLCI